MWSGNKCQVGHDRHFGMFWSLKANVFMWNVRGRSQEGEYLNGVLLVWPRNLFLIFLYLVMEIISEGGVSPFPHPLLGKRTALWARKFKSCPNSVPNRLYVSGQVTTSWSFDFFILKRGSSLISVFLKQTKLYRRSQMPWVRTMGSKEGKGWVKCKLLMKQEGREAIEITWRSLDPLSTDGKLERA